MQISIENNNTLWYRIKIIINANTIEQNIKKELLKISNRTTIDGFRKGKVPVNIILQRYSITIRENVLNSLIHNNFTNFITEKKINIAGKPKFILNKYIIGENFTYIVEFESYPNIFINIVKPIQINKPSVTIKDTDIDLMIEVLRKNNAHWEEIDDVADINDRVTINFSSTVEGKLSNQSKVNDFILTMNEGQMFPDFERSIINHKKDEHFNVKMIIPDGFFEKKLQNKYVDFNILLKKVERRKLPELNNIFIKKLGITDGSINGLRDKILQHMKREINKAIFNFLKMQLIDSLINTIKIEIPKSLLDKEIHIANYKKNQDIINKKVASIKSNDFFKQQAIRRIKENLLIEEIIRKYELKIDKFYVKSLIKEISSAYETPQEVINLYNKNKKLMNIVSNIALEHQAINILLNNHACITEKKISFVDFLDQINKEKLDFLQLPHVVNKIN